MPDAATQQSNVQFPVKLECLFRPARYKVLYGGRGGAKSWGVARALLSIGFGAPKRILCAREFQNSIDESVLHLLETQIDAMGLRGFYDVRRTEIVGANGTSVGFEGLHHNITSLKSYEGADICWVEEATDVSKRSWETLIPTIRKDGSEIWISFNPELDTDETYKRFVLDPPASAVVVPIGWRDNPWFPAVLQAEKDELARKDPDAYQTIWEGKCRQALAGAIYENELRALAAENRICRVPYDSAHPVETFWDLGWADNTSIWCVQFIGLDVRIIDHLSGSRRKISEYLADLQGRQYVFGEYWLPHDGEHGNVASEGETVSGILRKAGCSVRIVPRTTNVVADLDKVRGLFPRMLFDQSKCSDGLNSLRRYIWNTDDEGNTKGREPLHNSASHDADALRTLAMAVDLISIGPKRERGRNRSWKTA